MKNRKQKRKIRVTIMKRLSIFFSIYIILFIVQLSILKLNGITFSRYNSQNNKNTSMDIAKWDVSLNTISSSDTLNILAGDEVPQTYTLKIKSESEVSTKYTIILSNLPNGIEVSIDNEGYQTPQNNVITFDDVGIFNINETNTEHEHILKFKSLLDSSTTNISEINVDVQFSQII